MQWCVAVGLGVALLGACGTGAGNPGSGSTGSGRTGYGHTGSSSTTPTQTFTEDLTLTPTSPSRPKGMVELEGELSEGVEAGCLVLTTDTGTYTLIGRTQDIRPGARVHVRGAEAPDMATTCQQGTVFRVDAVL